MATPDAGLELLQRLTLVGQLMPDTEEMAAYARASDREETVGPLLYPAAFHQGAKRMRAARDLCLAGVRFARAFEALQEAAGEEADPALDAGARAFLQAFHRRYGRPWEDGP